MATFSNPVNIRTGGSVPSGAFEEADLSGVVGSALQFGAEQVRSANRRELGEEITEEAEGFIDQPENITELQRLAGELGEEEGSRMPPAQNERAIKKIKDDMTRLRRAVEQGAASATEVKMRADQLTRDAISDNPSLARDLISQRNQTLGLYGTELEATSEALQGGSDAEVEQLRLRQKKAIVDKLNEYGRVATDFSMPALVEQATPIYKMESEAALLEQMAASSEDRATLRENEAEQLGQSWVTTKFSQARMQLEGIIQREDLSDAEKIKRINDTQQQLRAEARGNEVLGTLSGEKLDSLVDPVIDRLESAKDFVNGERELSALKTEWDGMVYQTQLKAAAENPGSLAVPVISKFIGPDAGALAQQKIEGGVSGQIDNYVQTAGQIISSGTELSADQIDSYDKAGLFDNLFDRISRSGELGVAREDSQVAAKNLWKSLLPEDGSDLTDIELDAVHRALPILARTSVKDMNREANLNPRAVERYSQRLSQYFDTQLVPNLRSRMTEPAVRQQQRRLQARGAQGSDEPLATDTSVINFLEPSWPADDLKLDLDRSRIPPEIRNDPDAMQEIRDKVDKIKSTYLPRWNNVMRASANLDPDETSAKEESQKAWEEFFGDLQPPEEVETRRTEATGRSTRETEGGPATGPQRIEMPSFQPGTSEGGANPQQGAVADMPEEEPLDTKAGEQLSPQAAERIRSRGSFRDKVRQAAEEGMPKGEITNLENLNRTQRQIVDRIYNEVLGEDSDE